MSAPRPVVAIVVVDETVDDSSPSVKFCRLGTGPGEITPEDMRELGGDGVDVEDLYRSPVRCWLLGESFREMKLRDDDEEPAPGEDTCAGRAPPAWVGDEVVMEGGGMMYFDPPEGCALHGVVVVNECEF